MYTVGFGVVSATTAFLAGTGGPAAAFFLIESDSAAYFAIEP